MKMPPDLSEAARPVDALPTQSCRETNSSTGVVGGVLQNQEHCSTPRPVAENLACNNDSGGQIQLPHSQVVGSEARNCGEGCNGRGVETQISSPSGNMYHLIPALRATFASVGATDRAYSFREILQLLKKYLFSKDHLFDPEDVRYVNCGNDPLGQALQVTRFHFTDVTPLISKHIIQAQPKTYQNTEKEHASVPDRVNETCSYQITQRERASVPDSLNGTYSQTLCTGSSERHVSPSYISDGRTTGSELINELSATNGRTVLLAPSGTTTLQHLNSDSRETNYGHLRTPAFNPIPGPSRESGSILMQRKCHQSASLLSITITIPDIPDSISDAESVYSVQGYETALCRNTEFEESEDEEEVDSETFEEYEIASDDARVEEYSDDNDSVIEDVEVAAVLAVHALYQDEEDFWADDSDTDDQSIDNDPELIAERWDCLSCGLKNKPFVRYCGKCWQLRKNWLPDRPKKRKRKPRPKKRHSRFRSESLQSDEQNSNMQENKMIVSKTASSSDCSQDLEVLRPSSAGSTTLHSGEECSEHNTHPEESNLELPKSVGTSTGDDNQELLPRAASTASTISLRSVSPERKYPLDHYSSQDSGISLSQDNLSVFGENSKLEDTQVKETQTLHLEKPFLSEGTHTTNKTIAAEITSDLPASSSRKRKSSKDMKYSKRFKSFEGEDSPSEEISDDDIDIKAKARGFSMFLQSSAGQEWLKSPEGKLFQSSQSVQEVLIETVGANMSLGSSGFESHEPPSGLSNLCSVCCLRPKNASIIHGRLSHQATCYQCARRLLDTQSRCPVCRRKIHMVCKHIIV